MQYNCVETVKKNFHTGNDMFGSLSTLCGSAIPPLTLLKCVDFGLVKLMKANWFCVISSMHGRGFHYQLIR